MTAFLPDVNVVVALADPAHIHHDQAHEWFGRVGRNAFATCPLTENALVRIVGHPRYPNSPGPPSVVMKSLMGIRSLAGHGYWPDDIRIADRSFFAPALLSSRARVTDSYLLAPAHANSGRLATMDRRLAEEAAPEGRDALELV